MAETHPGTASSVQHTEKSAMLAEKLSYAIREGRYARHAPLPSHRDLCKEYGVGLRTVRRALDALEQEGILYRAERRGTFVRGVVERSDGSRTRVK